ERGHGVEVARPPHHRRAHGAGPRFFGARAAREVVRGFAARPFHTLAPSTSAAPNFSSAAESCRYTGRAKPRPEARACRAIATASQCSPGVHTPAKPIALAVNAGVTSGATRTGEAAFLPSPSGRGAGADGAPRTSPATNAPEKVSNSET